MTPFASSRPLAFISLTDMALAAFSRMTSRHTTLVDQPVSRNNLDRDGCLLSTGNGHQNTRLLDGERRDLVDIAQDHVAPNG